MDNTVFDQAVAVMKRLTTAQDGYRLVTVDGVEQEVGVAELEAAFDAFQTFWDQIARSGQRVDRDLADAVAQEQLTGRRNELIERDGQGRPVALRRLTTMTAEQIERAKELLADPDRTITSVAAELKVSRSTLYYDIPGITGRLLASRKRQVAGGRS
ncbi:helix-turn-helix domain-containing protein [Kitasatospora purpeofusca]|uniref:helix-turn-helix domain-containing protein n=1 Tax=Kitasatospora purpeofusca TaxID=67352 RepID=UPI0035DE00DB